MKVFCDGGCRPNPGAMEVAVVARGTLHYRAAGEGTSEAAEWLALLEGLAVAKVLGAQTVELLSDCRSVINQAQGRSRCPTADAVRYRDALAEAAGHFRQVRLRHVKRTQNLAGIALARRHQR
jgi:ribonuclease HI